MSRTVRFTIVSLLGALAMVVSSAVLIAYRFARLVLTPPGNRVYDLQVLELGYSKGEIVSVALPLNDDTVLPGQYSLVFAGGRGLAVLGEVMSVHASSVQRSVLRVSGATLAVGMMTRFNGWMHLDPTGLELPWRTILLKGQRSTLPAWRIEKARKKFKLTTQNTWAVHVHGRSATRAETLRGVSITASLGWTNLVCSYRNDSEVIPHDTHRYALGAEEWRDVEVALAHAIAEGASDIVLYGWSMGGVICGQLLAKSEFHHKIRAVVLDSPALDWADVLRFHAELSHVSPSVTALGMWMMRSGIVRSGATGGIPFEQLNAVPIFRRSEVPVLILHSEDDGYVPCEPSRVLAATSEHITLVTYKDARHCKLWNSDPQKYERAVSGWLSQLA